MEGTGIEDAIRDRRAPRRPGPRHLRGSHSPRARRGGAAGARARPPPDDGRAQRLRTAARLVHRATHGRRAGQPSATSRSRRSSSALRGSPRSIPSVEVLARRDGDPVLVRKGNVTAATFHPELTDDRRVLDLFLSGAAVRVRKSRVLERARRHDRLSHRPPRGGPGRREDPRAGPGQGERHLDGVRRGPAGGRAEGAGRPGRPRRRPDVPLAEDLLRRVRPEARAGQRRGLRPVRPRLRRALLRPLPARQAARRGADGARRRRRRAARGHRGLPFRGRRARHDRPCPASGSASTCRATAWKRCAARSASRRSRAGRFSARRCRSRRRTSSARSTGSFPRTVSSRRR